MIQFGDIYRGSRVLITGHTGFKGSWLAHWLNELGARIGGISLDPETQPNHWDQLNLNIDDHRFDIRNEDKVKAVVEAFHPTIVFHLAAQPLVRRSYHEPLDTWSTNVMGTAHLLEACRHVGSVQAIVVITTDKVYVDQGWQRGYRECDRLGGHDPYSASKAACELLIDSYRNSFLSQANAPLLASARAGNVIGGGDWSEDRLIPDLIRSVTQQNPLIIRSPRATRPWQHVLDCLSGYLLLGQGLLEKRQELAEAWNFGPESEDNRTVEDVLISLQEHWPALKWEQTAAPQPHETTFLYLDHAKAKRILDWQPVLGLGQAMKFTADWYRQFYEKGDISSDEQLTNYIELANLENVFWVQA